MGTILLVVYITAAVSMIVIILLQRSEGGALGMGGGGGLVTGRGAANFLSRATAVLATIFFTTAIALGILGHRTQPSSAVIGGPAGAPAKESAPASESAPIEKAPSSLPDLKLPKLRPETAPAQSSTPAPPASATPAPPQLPQSQ